MTTRVVGPIIAALTCTVFVAACGSGTAPPSKACIDAARLYAEALDTDKAAPEGEKAEKITIKKEALAALEERKVKVCGE